jgi:hypothetical protein
MLVRAFTGLLVLMMSSGYLMESVFYAALKHRAHAEMQEKIAARKVNGPFYNFTFSSTELKTLNWHKPDIEFELDGHMYDIIETKHHADGTISVCVVLDKKESELLANKAVDNDLKLASEFAKIKLFSNRTGAFTQRTTTLEMIVQRVYNHPLDGTIHQPSPPPDFVS